MDQQKLKSLNEIVWEYEGEISPVELRDILEAVQVLKKHSGWGEINIKYANGYLNDLKIVILQRPKHKNENTV